MTSSENTQAESEAIWYSTLTHGHRTRMAIFPGRPRCTVCQIALAGLGGRIARVTGRRPSRKSPQLCNVCEEAMPQGGAEVEVSVMFADVRGSTSLAERVGATAFAEMLNRFYRVASDALIPRNAIIDKMVGDEVMALFIPSNSGPDPRRAPVFAAKELLRGLGHGEEQEAWLPVGVGIHTGQAYVGKVGTERVNDFTALGDTVNTAARLQSEAAEGEIVMSEAVYEDVAGEFPGLEEKTVSLRGRDEPISLRILRL